MDFIAQLEDIEVTPDTPARIIINERTGTIVATARIQISSCAIAQRQHHHQRRLHARTRRSPARSATPARPTVTPQHRHRGDGKQIALIALPEMPTVEKVASALNTLGATPRDMMAIFQAMKQAGALQAELIVVK